MTKEEAIIQLQGWKYLFQDCMPEEKGEALDMAIEALKERPRGRWREITPEEDEYMSFLGWLECTNCISKVVIFSNFCPNCGADMRGETDEKVRSN